MTERTTFPEEPSAQGWTTVGLDTLWQRIRDRHKHRAPLIVAIDGRSAAGKSTLADAIAALTPGVVIVHTDDLAWHEPLFGWAPLLRDGVLAPLRRGDDVSFTPPAWSARGRDGAIVVPASAPVVLIEGVGSAHRSVSPFLDATIWVQSDRAEAERRGIARDLASGENGDRDETVAFWHRWATAERAYLSEDRPWERSDVIVAGTPPEPLPDGTIAVAQRSERQNGQAATMPGARPGSA